MSRDGEGLHEYLVKCMTQTMADAGVDLALARSIASQVEHEIRARYGADRWYVPAPDKGSRDRQIIYACLRQGRDRDEVARAYRVSRRRLNQILSEHLQKACRQEDDTGFGGKDWVL